MDIASASPLARIVRKFRNFVALFSVPVSDRKARNSASQNEIFLTRKEVINDARQTEENSDRQREDAIKAKDCPRLECE
jgi:hypothetical protein